MALVELFFFFFLSLVASQIMSSVQTEGYLCFWDEIYCTRLVGCAPVKMCPALSTVGRSVNDMMIVPRTGRSVCGFCSHYPILIPCCLLFLRTHTHQTHTHTHTPKAVECECFGAPKFGFYTLFYTLLQITVIKK